MRLLDGFGARGAIPRLASQSGLPYRRHGEQVELIGPDGIVAFLQQEDCWAVIRCTSSHGLRGAAAVAAAAWLCQRNARLPLCQWSSAGHLGRSYFFLAYAALLEGVTPRLIGEVSQTMFAEVTAFSETCCLGP